MQGRRVLPTIEGWPNLIEMDEKDKKQINAIEQHKHFNSLLEKKQKML
jgi:hypothetical protein